MQKARRAGAGNGAGGVDLKQMPSSWVLGWSITRFDTFTSCKRRYFYTYYPAFDSETPKRRIKDLAKLTTVAMEVGAVTHEVIAATLHRLQKATTPIDEERFASYATRVAEEHCQQEAFWEVHYGQESAISVDALIRAVLDNLAVFRASERFGWIMDLAARGNAGGSTGGRADWIIDPPGYGETRIAGLKAFCKPDFVCQADGRVFVFDWKTGKEDGIRHNRQLAAYAHWVAFHFDVPVEKVTPVATYLAPAFAEYALDGERDVGASDAFLESVLAETSAMYEYCRDVDRNRPLSKDAFGMAEDAGTCRWCNFKELCGR